VKRVIKSHSEGLIIDVSDIAGKKEELLAEFQACCEGRCSCPTDEYQKLERLEIDAAAEKISLRLRAKPGQAFDEAEIEKCLDQTETNLDSKT
jgi:hypothetical protein